MNIKEYIASGILEQYVLGNLSSGEEREVLTNATQYPEIRAELNAIETALEQYTMSNAVTPPPGLKDDILKKIDEISSVRPKRENEEKPGKSGGGLTKLLAWLPYILLPLLLVSAIWGYFGYKDNKNNEKVSRELGQELTDCRVERKRLQDKIEFYRTAIQFVNNENTRTVAMNGNKKLVGASTTIHTNLASKITYFAVNKLPKPPKNMQYQLWAIVDNTPVNMGVFDIPADPIAVDYIPNAQAYAISLEERGGAAEPNDVRVFGSVEF